MNSPAVLIVDDRPANLLALEAVLEPIGVPILRAASGEDALRELLKHGERIAVMLLDVQMPGLDGFQTARMVRARASLKTLPIIFITAVDREEAHIIRGYAENAVDYVSKPFNPDVLRTKVQFFVDLHARTLRLERTRSQGEQRLDLVLQAAELGSWSWDATTRQIVCDERCRVLLGVSRHEELTLDSFGFIGLTSAATDERLRVEFRARSGCWLRSQARAYSDGADGRLFGILADISDDKQLREERELFLGALGHDLRNPLQAIRMAAQLLERNGDENGLRHAQQIASAETRMTSLVNQLLDFVRSRSGGLPINPRSADLSLICREVIAEIELAHPTRHIVFVSDGPAAGHWDSDRLGQVVQNLITNALHHGDESESVRVTVEGTATEAILDVENDGDFIPPEMQSRMFKPFVSNATPGLGLGLYIVRQVVHAHGGSVEVNSPDRTTRFRVVLPKSRAPLEPSSSASPR